jgi:uncharacterized membrane protein
MHFRRTINFFIPFFLLAVFISFNHQAVARENVDYWYIKDFNSTIQILTDDSAIITEDITADCGDARGKHGIFRIIPTRSKTPDGTIYTPIELISITDFENRPYKYTTQINGGAITWKIGDPNITVSGENNYRIKYKVQNIIRDQEDFDEFYWNLSGNYWDLEIDNFKAKIILPEGINQTNRRLFLYDGKNNSKSNKLSSYNWLNQNTLEVQSNQTLAVNEGVTLSLSFPKGYITHQQIDQKNQATSILNIANIPPTIKYFTVLYFLFLPLLVFIIAFIFYRKKQKQNPYYKMSLVTEFDPPENISPIMLGLIDKNTVKTNLITASIVRMAVLKLIVIKEKEKKFIFIKSKKLEFTKTENQENYNQLDETEKYIFNILFKDGNTITSNKLQKNFTNEVPIISKNLRKQAQESGYTLTKKSNLKKAYLIAAIIFFFTGSIFTFVVLVIFYTMSDNLSKKGQKIYWRIQGFKQYMNIAEKERHAFYEKENIFTKLLPYSIAIGNVKEWVKKMADIYGEEYIKQSLYWYTGAGALNSLNSISNITRNIDSISKNINSSVGSSSGSAGGGFAGGGSGGGGGGGW